MATSERAYRLLALEALAACLPFLEVVSLGPAVVVGGVIVVSELLLVFQTLALGLGGAAPVATAYEPPDHYTVSKKTNEGKDFFFKWWFNKRLTMDPQTDTKHVPKRFQINYMLLVIHLESNSMMMDSGCRLEFLHIDFRNIRCDQESLEEWTQAEDIIYKLKSRFLRFDVR
nr:hypothetical protein [Tanacetum cinerariifolium]